MGIPRTYVPDRHTRWRVPLCEATPTCTTPAHGIVPQGSHEAVPALTPICHECCLEHGVETIQGFGALPGWKEAQDADT